MKSKLDKTRLSQINNINKLLNEHWLSPLWGRILKYRLERVLKIAEKDPHLKAAFKETVDSMENAEAALRVSNNILKSYIEKHGDKLSPEYKERLKLFKM
jgi:hypothetical protein